MNIYLIHIEDRHLSMGYWCAIFGLSTWWVLQLYLSQSTMYWPALWMCPLADSLSSVVAAGSILGEANPTMADRDRL